MRGWVGFGRELTRTYGARLTELLLVDVGRVKLHKRSVGEAVMGSFAAAVVIKLLHLVVEPLLLVHHRRQKETALVHRMKIAMNVPRDVMSATGRSVTRRGKRSAGGGRRRSARRTDRVRLTELFWSTLGGLITQKCRIGSCCPAPPTSQPQPVTNPTPPPTPDKYDRTYHPPT